MRPRLAHVAVLAALASCSGTSPRSGPAPGVDYRTEEPVLEGPLPVVPGGTLDRMTDDESGSLICEGYRVNGRREGTWRFFHSDGSRHSAAVYENGRRVGVWYRWYEGTSQLAERSHWDGTLHGPSEGWYPSGQMRHRGTYSHGNRVGEWLLWNESGEAVER